MYVTPTYLQKQNIYAIIFFMEICRLNRNAIAKSAVRERIENSKYVGHLAAFMSFGGGIVLAANANNPEHAFSWRGLATMLGGTALGVVELDMAKQTCINIVDDYNSEKELAIKTTLSDRHSKITQIGTSIAAGVGTSLAYNTYQSVGQVTDSKASITMLAGWSFMVAAYYGFRERVSQLNEFNVELNQQINGKDVSS